MSIENNLVLASGKLFLRKKHCYEPFVPTDTVLLLTHFTQTQTISPVLNFAEAIHSGHSWDFSVNLKN